MSATPVRLRPCLILAALVALPITPLLAGGDTGGAAAPAAGGTETQPVATTEPAAAPAADADLTSTFDIEGQWVYFTMFPKTDDNVDRDVFRFKLPTQGQSAPEAEYQRVTTHWGVDAFSRVSNDGRYLIYTSDRDRFQHATNPFYWDFELYIKDLQTGDLKRLTYTYDDRELAPAISDDGKRVVYLMDRFAQTTMSLCWFDTSKPYERFVLLDNLDKKTFAVISPDGKHVYYNALESNGRTYDIFRINLDTLQQENMTNTPGITELHVDIAGDGKTIVYERHYKTPAPGSDQLDPDDPAHSNRLFEIYTMNTDTKAVQRRTFNDIGDGFPSISRDGQWIVFQSARQNLDKEKGNEFELFAIKVGDKQEWQISSKLQSHDFVSAAF